MNDITKHKWSDETTRLHSVCDETGEVTLENTDDNGFYLVNILKNDAIAIANHFGLIPQSENTYASLNLDSVKTMKKTETIGDNHG